MKTNMSSLPQLKELPHGLRVLKSLASIFQAFSSPSSTILVPLWFITLSVVFFYLSKLLFSDLLQFKGNFVRG